MAWNIQTWTHQKFVETFSASVSSCRPGRRPHIAWCSVFGAGCALQGSEINRLCTERKTADDQQGTNIQWILSPGPGNVDGDVTSAFQKTRELLNSVRLHRKERARLWAASWRRASLLTENNWIETLWSQVVLFVSAVSENFCWIRQMFCKTRTRSYNRLKAPQSCRDGDGSAGPVRWLTFFLFLPLEPGSTFVVLPFAQ